MGRGITLLELSVTIVIIGILAAIAIPLFPKVMENTKASEAVAALQQIRTGERIYRVEENTYWPTSGTATTAQINAQLRLDLKTTSERSWDYSVGPTTNVAFTATATRRSGGYITRYITINQAGAYGGDWPLPIPGQ